MNISALFLVVSISVLQPACKGKAEEGGKGGKGGVASGSASSVVPKPAAPTPPPPPAVAHVTANEIKLTSCGIGPTSPEGENGIAAARGLHQAADGTLYFFADSAPPQRLDKVEGGCGYALAPAQPAKKDHEWGLDPDGKITEYPYEDTSPKTKCRLKALGELRYGRGALVGRTFYARGNSSDEFGDGTVVARDLADDNCVLKASSLSAKVERLPDVSGTPTTLFIGTAGPGGELYDRQVYRFDASGKLVKKYGGAGAPSKIERIDAMSTCGDGLCITESGSSIDVFDANGALLKTFNTRKLFDRPGHQLQGITEVPGKGVYVLIGYQEGKKGHAELFRVDGLTAP